MSRKNNLYLGKAGQFLVMSELLCRGWNVAIPEVDVGDDIFVVRDKNGDFIRVQVKTATGKQVSGTAIKAQFSINLAQLRTISPPLLVYAFVVRIDHSWQKLTFMRQVDLLEKYQFAQIGSVSGDNLVVSFTLSQNELKCGKEDFTHYLSNFQDFPIINH